ncbi:MAG: hypothetical protein N3D75_02935 [Candidatus Aenigmarchaeota archaeon]|nr:hypothetical protein [Candidatus Aenigmarchaeota archaeon]
MTSEYFVNIKPKDVSFDSIEEVNNVLIKNKPWFLILTNNKIENNSIIFDDENAGSFASIKKDGEIEYREKVFLDNKIDIIRTIAIVCGIFKMGKIVYAKKPNTVFRFYMKIDNLNGKTVLENEDLAIFGEIKIEADKVEINREFSFDKNFDAYKSVKEIVSEFCKEIDFPFDDGLLQKEIENAISVLDNPLMFAKKINLQ